MKTDNIFNITQQKILSGALEHWYMLEKVRSDDVEDLYAYRYEISQSMVNALHLKAFQMTFIKLTLPLSISKWENLNYFRLSENDIASLPSGIGRMKQIRYLSVTHNDLGRMPSEICEMTQLEVLDVQFNLLLEFVPECIINLDLLKLIIFDILPKLNSVPFGLFNLPNLKDLSLFEPISTI